MTRLLRYRTITYVKKTIEYTLEENAKETRSEPSTLEMEVTQGSHVEEANLRSDKMV